MRPAASRRAAPARKHVPRAPARPRAALAEALARRPAVREALARGPSAGRALARRAFALGPLLAPALLAALVAFLWLPALPGLGPRPTGAWRGYRVIAVRSETARGWGEAALTARLGTRVISDATATVDFWDFDGFAHVPYAALDGRLDPHDPRRDSYIDGAGGYFHTGGTARTWWIAYLPAEGGALGAWIRAARLLGVPFRGEWRLAEFDPLERIVDIACVFCFGVLLALSLEEFRRAAVLAAVIAAATWIPLLLEVGAPALAAAVIVFLAWFPLLRACLRVREWNGKLARAAKRPLGVFAAAALAAFAAAAAGQGFSFGSVLAFLSPLAASLLLLSLVPAFSLLAAGPWKRRRLFEPVPIVRPQADGRRGRTAAVVAGVSLVLAVVLPLARGAPLPAPHPVAGTAGFSWQALGRAAGARHGSSLPGYASLVTHAAFQQTIAFGRPWRTPRRDERVTVREYASDPSTGSLAARLRTVKVFDTAWLQGLRRRAVPGSLEALLYAQDRPVDARVRTGGGRFPKDLPAVILALVVLGAWVGRGRGLGPLIRAAMMGLNGAARRNEAP
jgi:hypothetical protein